MKIERQIFNTENSVERGILHGIWFNRVTEWRNIEFQAVFFLNNRFIVCGTKCTENLKALQSTDMIHGDNKVQTRF